MAAVDPARPMIAGCAAQRRKASVAASIGRGGFQRRATVEPAIPGPTTVPTFWASPISAFACWSSPGGTSAGTRPPAAGRKNASKPPYSATRTTRCHSSAHPCGEHDAGLRRRPVQLVDHGEGECHGEQRVADHGHRLAGEEDPVVAVAEDASPA
jgi:hypothetical protein